MTDDSKLSFVVQQDSGEKDVQGLDGELTLAMLRNQGLNSRGVELIRGDGMLFKHMYA